LRTEALAERANLSLRSFYRAFVAATGTRKRASAALESRHYGRLARQIVALLLRLLQQDWYARRL
jgi:transcriptional regulator GlxA family with amidase domain